MLGLIAATSMTAMLAGSADPNAQRAADLPSITISIHSVPAISPVIIDKTLEEATAIWRPTGVTFKWQKVDSVIAAARPTRPRVIIKNDPGTRSRMRSAITCCDRNRTRPMA
jgi:hypothetical protein